MTGSSEVIATWAWRERPILVEALKRMDEAFSPIVDLEGIRAAVGLDVSQMRAAIQALTTHAQPPYLEVELTLAGPNMVGGYVTGITERTRRELGSWPSAQRVIDKLIESLSEAAKEEPSPEKRGLLAKGADILGGVAKEIAVESISRTISPS